MLIFYKIGKSACTCASAAQSKTLHPRLYAADTDELHSTRRIQEANFAFSFDPTPSRTRRSSSRASGRRSRSVSVARSSHTPAARSSRQPSESWSARAGSVQRGSSVRRSTSQDIRRRASRVELENPPQSEADNASTSSSLVDSRAPELLAPSTRKRKRNADIPVTILEDAIVVDQVQAPEIVASETGVSVEKENAPPQDTSVSIAIVAEPPVKAVGKRKKRKSIGQRRKKRTSASSTEEFTILDEEEDAAGEEDEDEDATARAGNATTAIVSDPNPALDESDANVVGVGAEDETLDQEEGGEDEESEQEETLDLTQKSFTTTTKRPRRKRKSIAQQRKKKRTSTDSLPERRQTVESAETPFRRYDSEEDKSDYLPDDVESSPVVQRKKKQQTQQPAARRRPRASSHDESRSAASDGTITHRRRRSSSTNTSKEERTKPAGIPIIVHRMTNRDALPTIPEESSHSIGSDNEEEDEVARDHKRPKLSSPNAIDVVAQLCRETVESCLLDLTDSSAPTSRTSLIHKRNAISIFASNLETRLLDLSQTLDIHHSLLARLKQSKRLRSDLQNEWLDLRKQREELALRSDDIRRRNAEAEVEARDALALHEGLGSLEVGVERAGQGEGEEGLEYLLKTMAESTCDHGGGGKGLLDKIREFNGVLERTVMVLEGRV